MLLRRNIKASDLHVHLDEFYNISLNAPKRRTSLSLHKNKTGRMKEWSSSDEKSLITFLVDNIA